MAHYNDDDELEFDEIDDDEDDDFDDEWDDVDDNPDDDLYGDEPLDDGGKEPLTELDAESDQGDAEPEWWEDGMPDDWWDFYGDDYEVEEFEIAIAYGDDT